MYQLGWFSTGRDKAAGDLLEAVRSQITLGEIEAEIVFVFCSREPGESPACLFFLPEVQSSKRHFYCQPRWNLTTMAA